mmetsp:Transcript_8162/g.26769  ORF Transcript_8162/g.26769 Transcript_8162/m.26769 type:complete len:201 (+) Transcript_8162:971-1573(+)
MEAVTSFFDGLDGTTATHLFLRGLDLFVPAEAFPDFESYFDHKFGQNANKKEPAAHLDAALEHAKAHFASVTVVFADALASNQDCTFDDVDDYDAHLVALAEATPRLAGKHHVDLRCHLARAPPPPSHRRHRRTALAETREDASFDPDCDLDTISLADWQARSRAYHNTSSGDVKRKGPPPWANRYASNVFAMYARPSAR